MTERKDNNPSESASRDAFNRAWPSNQERSHAQLLFSYLIDRQLTGLYTIVQCNSLMVRCSFGRERWNENESLGLGAVVLVSELVHLLP